MKYIAYLRVSTVKQGQSGLGLEAQRSAVQKFTSSDDFIIGEYVDIESGGNNDRKQLNLAIEHAKRENAILLIAKLDRLSRNAAFIFTLRDAKIDFVCCDMPSANAVTIGIMAVLAQDEKERISQRTKVALQEAKKRGTVLGSPKNLTPEAIEKGLKARLLNARQNENNRKAIALIVSMHESGKAFSEITRQLNDVGFRTRKGCAFKQTQVSRLYKMSSNTTI